MNINATDDKYTGIGIFGIESIKEFWIITLPCGTVVKYPLNGLPVVDVPCPCGNPDHWVVKIYPKTQQ